MPHLSLERLAALCAADAIEIVHSGEDAKFLAGPDHGVVVRLGDRDHPFEAMLDARGQTTTLPADLPFPSLVAALANPLDPLQAPVRLALQSTVDGNVFCLSMPQILQPCPFSQGLPNCDTLAETVASVSLATLRAAQGPNSAGA